MSIAQGFVGISCCCDSGGAYCGRNLLRVVV